MNFNVFKGFICLTHVSESLVKGDSVRNMCQSNKTLKYYMEIHLWIYLF